jgi:hypothetical protein
MAIILESCSQNAKNKEVVYKDYSLKQLKGYLKGDWINLTEKNENTDRLYFYRFDFNTDSSGIFQNYEKKGAQTGFFTDAPLFCISKVGSKYGIKFISMFMEKKPKTIIIKTITDRHLELLVGNKSEVYEKVNFQK